jgi:hypothetical protein
MHSFLSKGALLAGLFLLAAGAVVVTERSDSYAEAAYIANGVGDFEQLSMRFEELARKKGGAYAFEVLRRAALPPQTDLHLLGHVIGDELYAQEGVGGIAHCTQDFRNACSHSIVIGALTDYGGETALPLIQDACEKAPGGDGAYTMCYHGLGHGVFAYFGYQLPETFDFCQKTGTAAHHQQEYVECAGGAIMELMGGGGHDPQRWQAARERYLRSSDPLAPCMDETVPADLKSICLVYLTPHLLERAGAQLARPNPVFFPQAFAYCDSIPRSQQPLRDACFGGFGKEFVPLAGERDIRRIDDFSDQEFKTAVSWCGLSEAEDGRAACVADALASVFWGGENNPETAVRFCSLVQDQPMQEACWERLAHDTLLYISDPARRSALCAMLPGRDSSCQLIAV